jgi:Ca-activated chloride channel family protein
MDKPKYTYRIRVILAGILAWEAIFWTLFGGLLWILGFFKPSGHGVQLAFRHGNALWWIALVPLCICLFLWLLQWKNKRFQDLGNARIQGILLQPVSAMHTFLKFFFFRNTLVFIILAMANPVFGTRKVSGTVESMELVLALDISNSMNVKDIDPKTSRLTIARRAMIQLINQLHGEKVGIVVFAGSAYIQLPLTADYEAAKMYINEIETDMISRQGTHIAQALEVSGRLFTESETSKAILLVTDGEDHEGGISEIWTILKEQQVQLAILGLGTTAGGLVPNNPNRPELGYKTDARGAPIHSRLNAQLVQEIARKTGGFSMISQEDYPDLRRLLTQINHLKRAKIDNFEFEVKESRYRLPLFLAILSWVLRVLWTGNSFQSFEKWFKRR